MAVRIERDKYEGEYCDILTITVGDFDDPEITSYKINIHQFDNLARTVFYWQYELRNSRKPAKITSLDDGTTHISRR